MSARLPTLLPLIALSGAALLLGGCASRAPAPRTLPPAPAPFPYATDGPGSEIPADLHQVPDAAPRLETIRKGGPNKPYEVLGQRYEPITEDRPLVERGLASWYGRKFHGRPTSTGEVYNMYAMSAAHPTMPLPSYARVRNPANGREVIVRVNDRGPFHRGRIIDLSYTAALKLDLLRGVAPVEVERITYEDIRSGAWLRGRDATATATAAAEPVPVYLASPASGAPEREGTAAIATARPDPAALLAGAEPAPAPDNSSAPRSQARMPGGFWLQLGSFRQLGGAETLRSQLASEFAELAPLLTVVREQTLHRLHAGPYASRAEAAEAAERLRGQRGLSPLLVERR